jgi:Glycosyl transferase 4-like domain
MTAARPNLLVIAPCAPPQNAAEAIQVGRILTQLDSCATGRLVTMRPDAGGAWAARDASLALALSNFDTQYLALPLHAVAKRLLMSHHLQRFHVPDALRWMVWRTPEVLRALPHKPDVIYTRSYPMSAALMGLKLANALDVPWIMHLSDPWADSPYGTPNARNEAFEAACFARADVVTLTTGKQAEHYRAKYPAYAANIHVCPNVMPGEEEVRAWQAAAPPRANDECLHLVFAGNLYGARSIAPLIAAIEHLRDTRPEILSRLRVDVYGHAQEPSLGMLRASSQVVHYHGPVAFSASCAVQAAADMVLSIEPDLPHPLGNSFLPSKVLECLALQRPLLAITPTGSETAALCAQGYGWAVSASNPQALAECLRARIDDVARLRAMPMMPAPEQYTASSVVAQLLTQVHSLMAARGK